MYENMERPTGCQGGKSLVDGMTQENGTRSRLHMINEKRDMESMNDDFRKILHFLLLEEYAEVRRLGEGVA